MINNRIYVCFKKGMIDVDGTARGLTKALKKRYI